MLQINRLTFYINATDTRRAHELTMRPLYVCVFLLSAIRSVSINMRLCGEKNYKLHKWIHLK